jgi:hypothetical protein
MLQYASFFPREEGVSVKQRERAVQQEFRERLSLMGKNGVRVGGFRKKFSRNENMPLSDPKSSTR